MIFRSAARESSKYMRGTWLNWEQQSRKTALEAGVTIISDIPRKPFEDAMAPIYAKAAQDPIAAALIDRIRKVE